MKPENVDAIVDLTYGVLIFVAIAVIFVVGTNVGIAFGLGVLVSYVIHIVWKMSRYDPDWMTREVADQVEKTVSNTVSREVERTVDETVGDTVSKQVEAQVEETVGDTVSREVDGVAAEVGDTVS